MSTPYEWMKVHTICFEISSRCTFYEWMDEDPFFFLKWGRGYLKDHVDALSMNEWMKVHLWKIKKMHLLWMNEDPP